MSNIVRFRPRGVVEIVTTAKFRMPTNPRNCNPKRYHVFRWLGLPKAPKGTKCQCGLLQDPSEMPE